MNYFCYICEALLFYFGRDQYFCPNGCYRSYRQGKRVTYFIMGRKWVEDDHDTRDILDRNTEEQSDWVEQCRKNWIDQCCKKSRYDPREGF